MNWIEGRRRRARRRRIARLAFALALVLLSAGIAGLFLPAEQVVSGAVLLPQPPETIWHVLTDLDGMPLWRSDLAALERVPDLAGRPAWRETGDAGTRVLELAVAEAPRRLAFRAAPGEARVLPEWSFRLESTERGTLLTLSERTRLANPLRRVLARFALPRGDVTRFLRDLEQRLRGGRRQVAAGPD